MNGGFGTSCADGGAWPTDGISPRCFPVDLRDKAGRREKLGSKLEMWL
jgi:hypothetical protein